MAASDVQIDTYDLIIVGAGPAGLSFVRALDGCDLSIALVDQLPRASLANPPVDGRDIALTHRSEEILRTLDIWSHIPADEIATIRYAKVVNGSSNYALHFDDRYSGQDYLGRLVANNFIRSAAYAAVRELANVKIIAGQSVTASGSDTNTVWAKLDDSRELRARLLVAADSRFSETRRRSGIAAQMRDFGRSCIVCRMEHDKPHDGTAFECFYHDRTLAVLPLNGRQSSVVITVPSDRAAKIVTMDKLQFNHDITTRFTNRRGQMRLVGSRHIYPLVATYADRFFTHRVALIGDAAVGMHPVTAHGFNLGLRGAAGLAQEIRTVLESGGDIGAERGLRRYSRGHDQAARPIYLGTNMLVGLYTDNRPPARLARQALLHLGNMLPPAREMITRQLTDTVV